MSIDFRKLLIAYIRHVRTLEGVSYLDAVFFGLPSGLTECEYHALLAAAEDDNAYPEPSNGELREFVTDIVPQGTPLFSLLSAKRNQD